jgi:hypothetical protein
MPLLLLPAQKDPAAGADRGWNRRKFEALLETANNLAAPPDFPSSVTVDAVPDVWGKALVFAYALRENTHQFHRHARDAFRGFLAMLALRVRRGLPVDVRALSLAQAPSSKFISAVRKLLPGAGEGIGKDAGWDPVYLFLLDGEVVGIASPLTLVAPREGGDMPNAFRLGLTDAFRFTDPVEKLNGAEAALVARWVGDLRAALANVTASQSTWRTDITTALDAFEKDLNAKVTAEGLELPKKVDYHPKPLPALDGHPLYAGLAKAIAKSAAGVSMVQLALQRSSGEAKVLLVDRGAGKRWGVPDSAVQIIDGVTLASLPPGHLGSNKQMLSTVTLPAGYTWKTPEEFLLPQLTVVKSADAFVSVSAVSGMHEIAAKHGLAPLLPLDEELMKYLTADYVARASHFREVRDGIEFVIELPVGDGRTIPAARIYPFADMNRKDPALMPVMEVWPGWKAPEHGPQWTAYFTFWANAGIEPIYIKPSGSGDQEVTVEQRGQVEVRAMAAPPESLSCFELSGRFGASERRKLGLLLPRYPVEEERQGLPYQVGFDFGTTNTEIYLRAGQDAPEPLKLDTGTLQICRTDEATRISLLYRYFIPSCSPGEEQTATAETAPFLSLLRRRTSAAPGQELRPIRESHVLFYRFSKSYDQLEDEKVRAHIKWQQDNAGERTAFLEQLAIHAALEAVRRGASGIDFYYSYPTAFTETMQEVQDAAWTKIVPAVATLAGVPCDLKPRQTESVASTYFFEQPEYGALSGMGTLVVDIGGGTSDISAWRQRALQIQSSIRLSGREILLEPLERMKTTVLPKLCSGLDSTVLDPLRTQSGERFYRRADALLRTHGDAIVGNLHLWLQDPDYERLRSEVALRFGGLFYYMGLMLRSVGWTDSERPRLPDVYVGGNGCRILNWLAPPVYSITHPVHRLLTAALLAGAGLQPSSNEVKIIVSKQPKSEAACGLLFSISSKLKVADAARAKVIAGESFLAAAGDRPATAELTPDVFGGPAPVRVSDLAELRRYLELYDSLASQPGAILLPMENYRERLSRAADELNDWLITQQETKKEHIQLEPFFVRGVQSATVNARWGAKT